ncbi:Hemolysin A [Jeotgalibaca dankookensis]|uniref:Hemolysin A n=1 Tax=Jeotgalibaca dankookensis TaxID=708126 RepID=A0A1S6IP24_9LACT|nr:TlyA family RNA methyltransferase [Jeotgalibaca dankookensis]AQS53297.1 Hemolysin A [Jeotgalibaca dankookensis]
MEKERIDLLVVQQGLADSREKAKRMVMAGQIYDQNNLRYDKAGEKVPVTVQLHIKGETLKYVSRGGLKLEKALTVFEISVADKIVLDIGSSTGGFTDAALQNGAKHCYALDVGTNQLDWKIRNDDRVTVMEQTNFRYSKLEDFKEGQPEFACMDVSFISLRIILPVLKQILKIGGSAVALIKPQFEAGKEKVGKKGIVSDPLIHKEVLKNILTFANHTGFDVRGIDFSPITGGTGNIEFIAHFVSVEEDEGSIAADVSISRVIEDAHSQLKNHTVRIH